MYDTLIDRCLKKGGWGRGGARAGGAAEGAGPPGGGAGAEAVCRKITPFWPWNRVQVAVEPCTSLYQ